MPKETLSRIHQHLKMDESVIEFYPKMIMLYDIFKPGDKTGVGYLGIKDSDNTYEFGTKLFFTENDLIEDNSNIQILGNPNSVCGFINVQKVDTDFEKIFNMNGKTSVDVVEEISLGKDYNYKKLPRKMQAIFQAYLKIRIIEVERKNNISPLEIFLLDTIEMNRKRYGKFDLEKNIKDLCKWYGFKEAKLNSGVQRRRVCRRWAKKDFELNDGKFISEYQYSTKT